MEQKAFAIKHISREILKKSSSGGAFTAISDCVLKQNGVVFGACYDSDTQKVVHKKAFTSEERDEMRGSKYIWSEISQSTFQECAEYAKAGKWVLFVGTPCQVNGVKGYLKKNSINMSRVILCDIICHGTPEPRLWQDYVELLNKKYGSKVDRINFKDKRDCWKRPQSFAYCGNRELSIADYTDLFYSQCMLRQGCYSCKYASTERTGDITIGDCWGIDTKLSEFYDKDGVSLLLINSEQGLRIFQFITDDIIYREIDLNDFLQHNLVEPTKVSAYRDRFLKDYDRFGIRYVLFKYSKHHLYGKIRHKISYLLNKR